MPTEIECSKCKFLDTTEDEQNAIKLATGVLVPHVCKKYGKRVLHYPYREPFIHPCPQCTGSTPREI